MKKRWKVWVHEAFSSRYTVEAENEEEAIRLAEELNIEQAPADKSYCSDRDSYAEELKDSE